MPRWKVSLTIALVTWMSGCGTADPDAVRPLSVVIFVIDTLRADQLGAYGDASGATPHIDALARESVLFENAHSAAPWTLPSVASLLTSTFPCEHEVIVDGDTLPSSITTLAERLRDAGYATASLYANPYAGAMSGLDRGFEHARQGLDANGTAVGRALPAAPFFLYVHNTGPHDPYQETQLGPSVDLSADEKGDINRRLQQLRRLTRADFTAKRPVGTTDNAPLQQKLMKTLGLQRETIRTLYTKDVARADHRLGDVVRELKDRGAFDESIFVLLSDHGEEFEEHGGWQHDRSVYEELMRVPLMIRLPAGRLAGKRVAAPVSLVDVMPTLAALLDLPQLAEGSRGRNLLPLLQGPQDDAEIRVTAMRINRKKYFRPDREARGEVNVVARQRDWKSIWNVDLDSLELYDLEADPGELNNLADSAPDQAASMRKESELWWQACRPAQKAKLPPDELDPEVLERLRALGYAD